MKRTIIPGLPHHAIHRGLHGRKTFFTNEDYGVYLEIMSDCTRHHGVEIWSYCLMPDHVHFIAIPKEKNHYPTASEQRKGTYHEE